MICLVAKVLLGCSKWLLGFIQCSWWLIGDKFLWLLVPCLVVRVFW